jgi:hypothetical protein
VLCSARNLLTILTRSYGSCGANQIQKPLSKDYNESKYVGAVCAVLRVVWR